MVPFSWAIARTFSSGRPVALVPLVPVSVVSVVQLPEEVQRPGLDVSGEHGQPAVRARTQAEP
jgi:hypothetical protein